MTNVETSLNYRLAELLDKARHNWTGEAEQRGVIKRGQIDVLIKEDGKPHVILEAKVGDKHDDVLNRFNDEFTDGSGRPRLAFEVKYDETLRDLGPNLLAESTLKYCVHFSAEKRFPQAGWLEGSVHDLAIDIQHARASIKETDMDADFNEAISTVAGLISKRPEATLTKVSNRLYQPKSQQTWGMAALTLSGAIAFHDDAAEYNGIPTMGQLTVLGGSIDYAGLLDAWKQILAKDYFPIFQVAYDLLESIPAAAAAPMLTALYRIYSRMASAGHARPQAVYNQGFQNVITERKMLASFYTKPAAAALLASLTVPKPGTFKWHDTDAVRNLHLADFACGTGALLLAAYRLAASYYELESGQSMLDLHQRMMSECLIGADVLPVACHMTAAGLAGVYPRQRFDETRIYPVEQGGKNDRIGSLDWIGQQSTLDDSETRLTGKGERGETMSPVHGTMDVILMNPPYAGSKGIGGRKQSQSTHTGQLFEAFGASEEERKRMAKKVGRLYKSATCKHKNSIATFFADLADAKIKDGGMLGLILPMTVGMGKTWEGFRRMISESYGDVVVVSAPQGGSFSADTRMGEIMVSARKTSPSGRAKFVSLDRVPDSDLEAAYIGRAARQCMANRIEDGPRGGTRLQIGNSDIGRVLDCPISSGQWMASAGSDPLLLQTVWQLTRGKLWFDWFSSFDVPITTIGAIGKCGPLSLDIMGHDTKAYRGPFNILPKSKSCMYPAIYGNHNSIQTRMVIESDQEAEPRPGETKERIEKVLDTMSRVHLNSELDTSSQSLPASYLAKQALGGTAWPSICLERQYEKAFVLWHNTTLGIMLHWASAGHQQRGRSRTSVTTIPNMPTLDPNELSSVQVEEMDEAFDSLSTKRLDRIMNLWKDETRIEIDNKVLEILGIDTDLDDLRRRLCRESTIYGRKPLNPALVADA